VEHNEVFYLKAKALLEKDAVSAGLFPFESGGASGSGSSSSGASSTASGPSSSGASAASSSGSSSSAAAEDAPRVRPAADGHRAAAPALPIVVGGEERRRHCLTHLPFRDWCGICVSAKAADPAHRRRPEGAPPTTPILQADFFFMNRRAGRDKATGISLVCVTTGAVAGCGLPAKSKGIFVVEFLAAAIGEWGYLDVVLRTDNEPAIESITKALRDARKPHRTVLETVPRFSHASLGHAENANRMLEEAVRCILAALADYGKTVTATDALFAWVLRHAAWLRHRFAVHSSG
jgi:hypothetical protein